MDDKLYDYILNKSKECIKVAQEWEEKINSITAKMTVAPEDISLKKKRILSISKRNEALTLANFCTDLLYEFGLKDSIENAVSKDIQKILQNNTLD